MASPRTPRMRNNVIGPGKPKEFSKAHGDAKLGKGLRKPKESKRARDAQGRMDGTQEPISNVTQRTNGLAGPLGE